MKRLSFALGLMLVCGLASMSSAQVLRVAELNTEQIRGLDRQRTVIILPGGILEEHGPYLPSYTDGYYNERLARDLAEAVAGRPGWTAVVFPTIALGSCGANEIGGKFTFPGSYTIRMATLRAVFMDLAAQLGEQGFRWIFVVHGHGAPHHNRALDEAGDYFHDTYGGQMVHLLGIMDVVTCCDAGKRLLSPEAAREDGFTIHAGAGEHASLLFLRPDLVPPGVSEAPTATGATFADLVTIARKPDWRGYFGSPRRATAAAGAATYAQRAAFVTGLAMKILDGYDPRPSVRYSAEIVKDPAVAKVVEDSQAHDAEQEAKQQQWLQARARRP
jgi:creatinine amidohydrolase/Fe(II)-dependent formamide hydrolase-like protein